jgi:hypothetical protein
MRLDEAMRLLNAERVRFTMYARLVEHYHIRDPWAKACLVIWVMVP